MIGLVIAQCVEGVHFRAVFSSKFHPTKYSYVCLLHDSDYSASKKVISKKDSHVTWQVN